MTKKGIDYFNNEKECIYKDEKYAVRDNGAVLRYSKDSGKKRKYDDIWTFGISVNDKGFYTIGKYTVHSIIATAFYGEPLNPQSVVFHKNYNKKDNRAENLLWVSKFQFQILQPNIQAQLQIETKKRKMEDVLEDFQNIKAILPQNLLWMRYISQEEINETLVLYKKIKSEIKPYLPKAKTISFQIETDSYKDSTDFDDIKAITPNAIQRNNWKVKSEFPCCPNDSINNSLQTYFENLKEGEVFCRNNYYESKICRFCYAKDKASIIIKSASTDEMSIKPWSLAEITYENNIYVHKNLGTFFQEDGVDKYFLLAIGEKWLDGDVFDDFC